LERGGGLGLAREMKVGTNQGYKRLSQASQAHPEGQDKGKMKRTFLSKRLFGFFLFNVRRCRVGVLYQVNGRGGGGRAG
jgi:hypothetical protein